MLVRYGGLRIRSGLKKLVFANLPSNAVKARISYLWADKIFHLSFSRQLLFGIIPHISTAFFALFCVGYSSANQTLTEVPTRSQLYAAIGSRDSQRTLVR